MEKLFARNGISLLAVEGEEGIITFYAYTEALLAHQVLIKIYTVVLDDTNKGYEEETAVIAITYDRERSYSYVLFVSHDVTGPLLLYRIVADAIDFIQHAGKKTLLEDLETISTGHTTSDDLESALERKELYESEVKEFNAILALIAQGSSSNP
ncbi:hypothetical protein [Chitinophaga sp. YIM B06452]|uniref:hypothetical protein n=1 Tax=Chitinophaga sp. YIM B06452 TaxID=3082158 RepID=UPI0031FEDE8E